MPGRRPGSLSRRRDRGVTGCGEIFRGESEEDVLEKAAEHSKNVHHLKEIPKSLRKKMHRLIEDVKAA
jgi:predicted small metal-binding protein